MKNRLWFGFAVAVLFVSSLIIPHEAVAGRVHARVKITWRGILRAWCNNSDADYSMFSWGSAKCYRARSYCRGYALEEWRGTGAGQVPYLYNRWWTRNYKKNRAYAGAWHSGSMPIRASEMSSTACAGPEPDTLPPPIPGDTATAADLGISYIDLGEGHFDMYIDTASFLQVYLGDVDEGDSTEMEWKLDINGEISRVRLVGFVLPGAEDSVAVAVVDGRFATEVFTLTPYPNSVYVMTFDPLHFTALGTVEESFLEIASGDEPVVENIPTLTEWGMIIFCALLFSWMAWVLVRRRKRITIGM